MKNITPSPGLSMTAWIIIITSIAFVLENACLLWFRSDWVLQFFGLSPAALQKGWVWTFLTYGLLHEPVVNGGLWHILFNVILIYFTGRVLEADIGRKNLLWLYITSGLWGGIVWTLIHWSNQGILIGASAAAIGLLTLFCLLHANEYMTFLLFFILPVTLKPKWLLVGIIVIELLGFAFSEMLKQGGYEVANSAHLGGILGGFIFYGLFYRQKNSLNLGWMRPETRKKRLPSSPFKIHRKTEKPSKEEIDRILDKISQHGFGALSEDEKAKLERARDNFSG